MDNYIVQDLTETGKFLSRQIIDLECPSCFEQYGEGEQIPRSLKCGHTFCTKCLRKKMTSKGIECPVCFVWHVIDLPDITLFPPNYAVYDILTKKNVMESDSDILPTDKCVICKGPATEVCIDCQPGSQTKFCQKCEEKEHNRGFEPVRRHRRYQKDQVPSPKVTIYCSRHRENKATLYSESLHEFACDEVCTSEPDWPTRSTNFEPMSEAVKRLRIQAQGLSVKSKNVVMKLRRAKKSIRQEIDALEPTVVKVRKEIRVQFTELIDVLQERKQKLDALVKKECSHREEWLQEKLERYKQTSQAVEDILKIVQTFSLPHSLPYFLDMLDKLEDLQKENIDLFLPVTSEQIPFIIPESIFRELSTIGTVGGGVCPIDLQCNPGFKSLMQLSWQLPNECRIWPLRFQIEYSEERQCTNGYGNGHSSPIDAESPQYYEVSENTLCAYVDYLCPGYKYRFRIRSANESGWGLWSETVVGECPNFPITLEYIHKIIRIRIPASSYYRITANGAKAANGKKQNGGHGAIISGTFYLEKMDVLIILSGGMSQTGATRYTQTSGGGGGTFVALNDITEENLLMVAGGGGGMRDLMGCDGCDASLEPNGTDGTGEEYGIGGVNGGPGNDAEFSGFDEYSFGHGGAGFMQDASHGACCFSNGGSGGQSGGFGGGGAVGMFGGGGGGGYSGGGGGRGGGGGGSYVRSDAIHVEKKVGSDGHGSVEIDKVYIFESNATEKPGNMETAQVEKTLPTTDSLDRSKLASLLPKRSSEDSAYESTDIPHQDSSVIVTVEESIHLKAVPKLLSTYSQELQ